MDIRLKKLSETIVNHSVKIKKNDRVLIQYQPQAKPLVKELIQAIKEKEGIPFIKITDPEINALILENADENSLFEYNVAVPFDKQDISEDAKNVLAMLFRLFIIDDDKKQELSKNDAMIEENYQKEIKEKYDPDNLFKKSNVENVKKEVALVEVKEEKWYQKILTFFRKLFRK